MAMKRKVNIRVPPKLFSEVDFFLDDDLDDATAHEIRSLLLQGGAVEAERQGTSDSRFSLDGVTHVFADSEDFPEYRFCIEPSAHDDSESDRPKAVSPEWVRCSVRLGILQKERHFSCLSSMIFSGLCVTAVDSKVARADCDVLSNVVPAYGGMWRGELYSDVNVLLTTSMKSKRVSDFLKRNTGPLIVAAPNWINDSWQARKLLPLDNYQFDTESDELPPCLASANASTSGRSSAATSPAPDKTAFKNKCILLSRDIGRASMQQLRSLEHFIRNSGGTVRRAPDELKGIAQAVRNSDYVVCRFRDVQEYREAIRQNKTVGNMTWLISVISNDAITDPKDVLLHYPIPRATIPEFRGLVVTITSYRGEQRAYLTKLIKLLGFTFDGTLTRQAGLCVAANMQSEKTLKARDWSVPVVNHRYIVDCFLSWSAVERDNLRYIDFPDGVDYNAEVGEAKITDESLAPWIQDAHEADEPADLPGSDSGMHSSSTCVPSSTSEAPVEANDIDSGAELAAADSYAKRPVLTEVDASLLNQDTPSKKGPRKRKLASEEPEHADASTPKLARNGHTPVSAEQPTPPASDAEDEVNQQLTLKPFTPRTTSSPSPVKTEVCKIMTSNYSLKKEDVSKLRRIGIHVVENVEEADMLVTPKLSRSPKMLYAIAKGVMGIVQPSWIEACLQAETVVDSDEHGLQETPGDKSYGTKLDTILERRAALANGLYEGHSFWLARSVDDSFRKLILAAGGKVLAGTRDEGLLLSDPEHYHFIVDENHKAEWKDLLGQETASGEPLRLYRRELISDSIFTQQLRWDHQFIDLENGPVTPKAKPRQGRASLTNSSSKRARGRPTM